MTQSGTNSLHGTAFEFFATAPSMPGIFRSGRRPPFRRNQFGAPSAGRSKRTGSSCSETTKDTGSPSRSAMSRRPGPSGALGILPTGRRSSNIPNLNRECSLYGFMARANGNEFCGDGQPSGTALSNNNPDKASMKISARCEPITILVTGPISGAYTIDEGNSIIPSPILCSAPPSACGARSPACKKRTWILSPRHQHLARRLLPARSTTIPSAHQLPRRPRFVRRRPRAAVAGPPPPASAITSAGRQLNAANVWNRRNLFTVTDGMSAE